MGVGRGTAGEHGEVGVAESIFWEAAAVIYGEGCCDSHSARPLSGVMGKPKEQPRGESCGLRGSVSIPISSCIKWGRRCSSPRVGVVCWVGVQAGGRKRLRAGQQDTGQHGSALGVSILTTLCLHRSIFPSAGLLQPGGYFLPFSLSPRCPPPTQPVCFLSYAPGAFHAARK